MIGAQRTRTATMSGYPIVYADPGQTPIDPDDLKYALAGQNRYNGHSRISVLMHLAACVDLARTDRMSVVTVGYVAAHDLHEAYVGDMPTGLKEVVADFREIEDRWHDAVHEAIGLTVPVPAEIARDVKLIDRRALVLEQAWIGWAGPCAVADRPLTDEERRATRWLTPTHAPARAWTQVWTAIEAARAALEA